MVKKIINFIIRLVVLPLIYGIIAISYNVHAIRNSLMFLIHGGEWITYNQYTKKTVMDLYVKLDELDKKKKI